MNESRRDHQEPKATCGTKVHLYHHKETQTEIEEAALQAEYLPKEECFSIRVK
jgi:hypothetical protein